MKQSLASQSAISLPIKSSSNGHAFKKFLFVLSFLCCLGISSFATTNVYYVQGSVTIGGTSVTSGLIYNQASGGTSYSSFAATDSLVVVSGGALIINATTTLQGICIQTGGTYNNSAGVVTLVNLTINGGYTAVNPNGSASALPTQGTNGTYVTGTLSGNSTIPTTSRVEIGNVTSPSTTAGGVIDGTTVPFSVPGIAIQGYSTGFTIQGTCTIGSLVTNSGNSHYTGGEVITLGNSSTTSNITILQTQTFSSYTLSCPAANHVSLTIAESVAGPVIFNASNNTLDNLTIANAVGIATTLTTNSVNVTTSLNLISGSLVAGTPKVVLSNGATVNTVAGAITGAAPTFTTNVNETYSNFTTTTLNTNAATAAAGTSLTFVTAGFGVAIGQLVTGTNIPANTYVTSITSGITVGLSNVISVGGVSKGQAITFTN